MGRKKKTRKARSPAAAPARAPRPRRRVARALAAVALLAAALAALWAVRARWPGPRGPEAAPLRNLVIVTGDTIRADRLPVYGYDRIATPALDRLAAEGVVFEHASTVVPLTLPAHSSIFTGTYPLYHGVRDNGGYYLEDDAVTLAEVLREKGYATGAFVAAFVLDSRWGLAQGFDRYFDDFDFSKYEKVSLDTVQRRGDEVLAEALAWMETVRERPFFSWIHLYDAHTPYDPPEPYLSRYGGRRWGRYDGEIAYVDSLVGELVDWLEKKGLAETTALVFVGDHGESLGDHKEITHGFFIYDATMRVPFLLKAPGWAPAGRRVAAQVRTIDLMPTVLDLLGVATPDAVQGTSLLPLVRGEADDLGLLAYGESYYPRHHYGWSELKSLRTAELHFIDAPRPELFDLRTDPAETKNLAAERPGTVRQLRRELERIVDALAAPGVDERAPEMLDAETQAQLAALGYIGGPSKIAVDPDRPLADPKDKIHLVNLIKDAGADSSEGKVDEALAKIERVLAEDPDILEAHHIRGNLFVKKGELDRAMEAYREALARDPEYKPALFGLASVYQDRGSLDEAAAGYRRILELDPRDNRAAFNLARILARKSEFDEALELLDRAVDLGSERAPLHNLRAECLIGLERWGEAKAEVEKAIALRENLPTAHYNLALILEGMGDLAGAARAYEKEIAIAPRAYKAHFNLAKLYGRLGRPEKMVEHFEKSIEANPRFAEGHLFLAKYYLDTGELDRAIELAKKGIELGPEPAMAPLGHYILADVYNRLGRFGDAERELARARSLEGS